MKTGIKGLELSVIYIVSPVEFNWLNCSVCVIFYALLQGTKVNTKIVTSSTF